MKNYKILMLSDHALSTSGVGTQSRFLIQHLLNTKKYQFRCFGAAVKHDNYSLLELNPDFKILPVDGFGTKEMLRQVLYADKPDCILLFTDPRFFTWVWEMEDEIHQVCPIAYNHLWDNYPYPQFNEKYYKATDLINCINWSTYEMLKKRFPEKVHYIPHGIPEELYFSLPEHESKSIKKQIFGDENKFVGIWVNRNAKRKMPADVLMSWKIFLENLKEKYGHKNATLLMHTDPKDMEGPDLESVIGMLEIKDNVVFSTNRVEFQKMNVLYNAVDFAINRSSAEGFGLPTLEAMFAGKPIIALKTGGLSRQVVNPYNGEEYGVGIDVEVKSLIGTQMVPYIYEDHVSHETVANAFMKMYEYGPEKRREIGKKAQEYVKKEYSMLSLGAKWDMTLENIIETWREKRKSYESIEI